MSKNGTYLELKRIKEQVIVITGASSGIGLVTAREAARRGARLVLMARNKRSLDALRDELMTFGVEAIAVAGDVTREEDVRRTAESAIERFGGFDTWVNNAGVSIYGRVLDISMKDQQRLFETNFWGVVHGARVAVEHLRSRGGALINMGSITSDRAIPLQGIYSASKHAIKAYTDALRMELEHDGVPVSVSLVKPSSIDTPFSRHAKNLLPREPRNPPPLHSPDLVADAILHCAEHRRREITVGGSGRMITAIAAAAPRTTDDIMDATLFDMQMTDTPARANGDGNLYHPANDFSERGDAQGRVNERSVETRAAISEGEENDALAKLAGSLASRSRSPDATNRISARHERNSGA